MKHEGKRYFKGEECMSEGLNQKGTQLFSRTERIALLWDHSEEELQATELKMQAGP